MNVVAIVQARMGSTRLPGKVLADLAGKPVLARVIKRVQAIPGIYRVVVATTRAERDYPLLELAKQYGAHAFAGSEDDVLDRYYQAAQAFDANAILRLTADCPLLDPMVSAQVLSRFRLGDVDYSCNTQPPTFPDGLDTEVFSFAALERAWREAKLTSEREHVTSYIWKNPNKFRLANVVNDVDWSSLRWTVDEPQDLEFVRAVYTRLYRENCPPFKMADILGLLREAPEISQLNKGIDRNVGYVRSLQEDR